MNTNDKRLWIVFLAFAAFQLAGCRTPLQPLVVTTATPVPVVETEETSGMIAASAQTDLEALMAQPWLWTTYTSPDETVEIDAPARYSLLFSSDGIVEIVADCNTAIAAYGVTSDDAGPISLEVAPRTTAVCAPGSRGEQFQRLLGGATQYFFQDGKLTIELIAGGTMVFEPAGLR